MTDMTTTKSELRADGFFHRRVSLGDVTLHVAENKADGDRGTSPLVVLLHGYPEYYRSWRHQLERLGREGYWAVAPDMRGYNESDKPESVADYEVERLADDVANLIRALGRTKAVVVGHDWGGMVAWQFAQQHPELLERLAILNVPHPLAMMKGLRRFEQLKKSWYMFFFQLPFGFPERTLAKGDYAFLRHMFKSEGLGADEIEGLIDAFRIPGVTTSAMKYYRASIRRVLTGRTPRMKTIEHPVLVIWGDKDRHLGSEMAEPPKRFVPNARVVHIPEASHWVQNTAPERVNELLLEFLRYDREQSQWQVSPPSS